MTEKTTSRTGNRTSRAEHPCPPIPRRSRISPPRFVDRTITQSELTLTTLKKLRKPYSGVPPLLGGQGCAALLFKAYNIVKFKTDSSNNKTDALDIAGQTPIKLPVALWLVLLIVFWAANSVVMGFVVKEIPPAWAAFLRFGIAFPFIAAFIAWRKTNLKIPRRILLICLALSCLTFTQIMLFIIGSKHTTGGRVTLFIFTYPLFVPFIAHFILKAESLNKQTVIGSCIAFIGVLIPLRDTLFTNTPTFKGDIIELASSVVLGLLIVVAKYAITHADKWAVFFWQAVGNLFIFGAAAAISGGFDYTAVSSPAWGWLLFQALGVSVFAFMSYQWILSKHNSSKVSIFFFATPLCGMILGGVLRNEAFDASLLAGCLAVGIGIFLANRPREGK